MKSLVSFPRYEEYKDSGEPWIGNAPEHWKIVRLGALLSSISIKNRPELPLLSITREQGVILRDRESDENHNYIPDDLSNYKLLKKGQFGMNKMKAWQGSYGISNYTGIVSPAYFIFNFTKAVNPDFFNWAIRSCLYVSFFGSASDGVRIGQWDLSQDRMKVIPFLMPEVSEQKNIATFLNQKTAQIDQAIEIKKKQIELLKERQQVIIQQAVTKGLDPSVKMKDSGVEWIGEVPEHWEVTQLKRLAKLSPKVDTVRFKDDLEVTFLPMEKVSEKGVITTDLNRKLGDVRQGFTPFNEGDVIVAKITPCFENGKSAYLEKIPTKFGFGSTEFHVLRSYGSISGWFLYYVVRSHSFLSAGEGMMTGSAGQKRVPSSFVSDFLVALPNENEQKQIVAYLKDNSIKIMESIALYKKQIKKLQEYKSSLINSAVTGKIKITPDMIASEE